MRVAQFPNSILALLPVMEQAFEYEPQLLRLTQAKAVVGEELVQTLWSGYGRLLRVQLAGSAWPSVIVKLIAPPAVDNHPRGWNTQRSHVRKLQSYRVEEAWYKRQHPVRAACRIPQLIGAVRTQHHTMLVLEDLDAAGFHLRKNSVSVQEAKACLQWLAHFHAQHLQASTNDLWSVGTYWHLNTRPDEWAAMPEGPLKQHAAAVDARLTGCQYRTLVHGDAKLANFCFAPNGGVAAVDFQYVGGGCGMKDVAYFISSCFDEAACERYAPQLLDAYFEALAQAVPNGMADFPALEREWRLLYPFAWADFTRFLLGWMPGHWKLHGYSQRMSEQALEELRREGL